GGRGRWVGGARDGKERRGRPSATASRAGGTEVEPNAQKSALRAEAASRRRFVIAAAAPATSAYTTRPSVTTRAARPRSAIYEGLEGFEAVYFEGHFVTTLLPASCPCS